ncbi:MAG: hypothetical protein R3B96_06935 [Pirellulaceae bacterium]
MVEFITIVSLGVVGFVFLQALILVKVADGITTSPLTYPRALGAVVQTSAVGLLLWGVVLFLSSWEEDGHLVRNVGSLLLLPPVFLLFVATVSSATESPLSLSIKIALRTALLSTLVALVVATIVVFWAGGALSRI